MRAVVQRVSRAAVSVEGREVSSTGIGLLVLVGISSDDDDSDVAYIVQKIAHLRVFEDTEGRMNRSVLDEGGEVLLVSQFTLYGDARGGRRPSYAQAAPGALAIGLFESVVEGVSGQGVPVSTGEFGAHMVVSLANDGPVTILLDSGRGF